jgi:hypothetical protein
MGINWSAAWAAGQSTSTPTPTPTPTHTPTPSPEVHAQIVSTPAAAAPATSSAANLVSAVEQGVASLFGGLVGLANDLVAFGESTATAGSGVGSVGNIGSPQCSNMIKVNSVGSNAFTNNFINTSPEAMTVVLWNKGFDGPNGVEANLGSAVAPETPCLTFALNPGQNQIVAFQADTSYGWAQATSAKTPSGAFATSWGEGTVGNGGSGYDLSTILNPNGNNYIMSITAAEVSCTSDNSQNYWIAVDNNPNNPQPVGTSDGSCYVPGNSATLTTKMGGTSS